jgi:hypothetical protein
MKKPSKKQIAEFLNANFPHIEFDGIIFEESRKDHCWFKIISFGRMIGQADYFLDDNYWENVKKHLKWALG